MRWEARTAWSGIPTWSTPGSVRLVARTRRLGWPDVTDNPPLDGRPDPWGTGRNECWPISTHQRARHQRDIITLWVARMVIMGHLQHAGGAFSHVCVHPKILDGFGAGDVQEQGGTAVDPMDLIDIVRRGRRPLHDRLARGGEPGRAAACGLRVPALRRSHPADAGAQSAKPSAGPSHGSSAPSARRTRNTPARGSSRTPTRPWRGLSASGSEYGRQFLQQALERVAVRHAQPGRLHARSGCRERAAAGRPLDHEPAGDHRRFSHQPARRIPLRRGDAGVATSPGNEFCDWYLEMLKPRLRMSSSSPPRSGCWWGCSTCC